MNKKRLIYLGLFIIFVIVAWLLISFWSYNKKDKTDNNQPNFSNMTAREVANWDEPFLKEVKLEFMEKGDLEKLNLPEYSAFRLQVLERDASGEPIAYKKIYSDEDIIRYKVDYSGTPDIVSTSSATSTELK